MCILVVCQDCNKYSWKGCGKHLVELYKGVEKGNHCTCRPWPGVVVPPEDATTDVNTTPNQPTTLKSSVVPAGTSVAKEA